MRINVYFWCMKYSFKDNTLTAGDLKYTFPNVDKNYKPTPPKDGTLEYLVENGIEVFTEDRNATVKIFGLIHTYAETKPKKFVSICVRVRCRNGFLFKDTARVFDDYVENFKPTKFFRNISNQNVSEMFKKFIELKK